MNILSNVIRGGQLSLHALRMFKQVLNLLLLWAVFVRVIYLFSSDFVIIEFES